MQTWYNQEITHLIMACQETYSQTSKGQLLQATGGQLQLEMGLPGSFTKWPFDSISECLTDCWLKTMLLLLHRFKSILHDTLP